MAMNTIQEILDYAKNPPESISPDRKSRCDKIAKASHLYNPELFSQLPAKFSHLFQLSKFSEEELLVALEERVIHPNCSYHKLKEWRAERNNTRVKDNENYEIVPVVVLVKKGKSKVDKAIKEIKESLYFMDAEVFEVDKLLIDSVDIKFRWRKSRMGQILSEGGYDLKELDKLKIHIERIGGAGTQQQRYASKNLLKKWAKSGNVLASRILSEIYGE